ncbi:MAG: exodeoxyribonuclease VII small subunit [Eubacterium sp.]|nr:exodeoxyribonuclease VII small subunit [Eubacterium sp.]
MSEINLTYEEAVERLNEIVESLEKNDVPLDKALELFEEGTRLTAFCTKKLNEAKQKITELEKD